MRLHLVDGTYELYRAHYSPRPGHLDPSGADAKATVGIVESMLALLHEADEAVTHIAVAFDNPIRSFRNDLYAPYKSDEGVPPELHAQFDAAEEAMARDRRDGLVDARVRGRRRTRERRTPVSRRSRAGADYDAATRISASASAAIRSCRSIGARKS